MKRVASLVSLVLLTAVILSSPASAVTDFHFDSFSADYYLSRDESGTSRLRVDEKLVAVFAVAGNDNHGIERAIPEVYKFDGEAKTQSHSFDLEVHEVSGGPYTMRSERNMRIIRIGDPDKFVQGVQEYGISWSASNVTRNFDSGDEFYWDVNGDGWSQPFKSVEARVHVPQDLAAALDGRVLCWAGDYGQNDGVCHYTIGEDGEGKRVYRFWADNLDPNQTLTFAIGFKAGTFAEPRFDIAAVIGVPTGTFWAIMIAAIFLTVAMVVWLVVVLKKFRPAKTNRAIIPQYLPPTNMSVVEAAVWWLPTQKAMKQAFPAELIDLTVRHYIQISETKRKSGKKDYDYEIELLKLPDDELSGDAVWILTTLFTEPTVGQIINLRTETQQPLVARVLRKLVPEADRRLFRDKGFYRKGSVWIGQRGLKAVFWTLMVVIAILFAMAMESLLLLISVVPVSIGLISSYLFNPISMKGAEAKDYLRGLEMYMKVGEAERLKILQSVSGAERVATDEGSIIKLYERLLPYAVIFGITKDWARALQVYYEADPSLTPTWYVGANLATFNAARFASAVNSFSSTSSYVSGAGSISSGGSGFGGGGFSGGGGGGGGGGGW